MPNNSQGSTWNRWDLHFHTPSSFDYEDKSITNAELIEGLKKMGTAVVAVTDHHTIDVQRIQELQSLAGNEITILPGIEFRSELGGKEKVHFIGIFSESCNLQDVWTKVCGKLNLTTEDIAKAGGDQGIYVDLKDAADIIHEQGGIVTAHAGGKSNSIEKIGNNEKFKIALKVDLARDFIDLFEVGGIDDIESYEKIVFPAIGFSRPLVLCSDNHNIKTYTVKTPCWIKGDPSFRTFQQLMSDPGRAKIVDVPAEVLRVSAQPTKYMKCVSFSKDSASTLSEVWFSGSVELNPGLIAIIGNKGNGKTALAEALGLLGNCERSDDFSFLNERKFCKGKKSKASAFTATLEWRNGHKVTKKLSDQVDSTEPADVIYIPQNYLESICNDVDNLPGSDFDQELKSVIFSHVADDQRLNADSLDDLLLYKTNPIEDRIEVLQQELRQINLGLVQLEEQNSPKQKQLLLNLTQSKERELAAHDLNQPAVVAKPDADPLRQAETVSLNASIADKTAIRENKTKVQQDSSNELKLVSARSAAAARLSVTLANFEASHTAFLQSIQSDCQVVGIDPTALIQLTINKSLVTAASDEAAKEGVALRDSVSKISDEIAILAKELVDLTEKLDAPNSEYQRYLEAKRKWEAERKLLVGSSMTPETIEYFKAKTAELKNVPGLIKAASAKRDAKVQQIFHQKMALVQTYRELYKPVQDFIRDHPLAKDRFKLEFEARVVSVALEDSLLGKINQARKGSFSGSEDGRKVLSDLVSCADFQTGSGVKQFTDDLMQRFEVDFRLPTKPKTSLSEQVRANVEVCEVLDEIFGLGYLVPQYELRWFGKELSELSPGERGTLLLIFYLLIDKRDVPLVIDQPEENLDNETVYFTLVPCLTEARERRQIVIVTHNPNLAVVADADQIIHCSIDKQGNHKVTYLSGGIENPPLNQRSVTILEGTRPAFDHRNAKYQP